MWTEQYIGWLASGLVTTLVLFFGTWLVALLIALVVALARIAPFTPGRWLAIVYIEYHQNVPLFVQILFWYFGVPELLPSPVRRFINDNNSEFILAFCAISFCFSAYMAEALRSSIRAIHRGQFEAARSLGFNYIQTMFLVVFPQAMRAAVPPLTNLSLLLFKNTSLAMAVGVHELSYQMLKISHETFRTFEVFAVVTIIYLIISLLIMRIGVEFERRLKRRASQ